MRKIFTILLIGFLSVLFAEIFSGASQIWFIDPFAILIMFPLYLLHVLVLFCIALKVKKASIPELYLFGIIFGLYESWITKVLWSGYIGSAGPSMGTFLGIATIEFPVLVFFWHPVMSFIMPILTYEILTKKVHKEHEKILVKTRNKTIILILSAIAVSSFVASGNKFDFISANISVIGTSLLIALCYYYSKKEDFRIFDLKNTGFIIALVLIIILYILTFLFMFSEKIPNKIMPFVSILFFYALTIAMIIKSKKKENKIISLKKEQYDAKDLTTFLVIIIIATNISCLFQSISAFVLVISYLLFTITGIILFALSIKKVIKENMSKKN
jgi:hypothetical protein